MSLINCTECNKEISSSAESCPNCGHPVRVSTTPVRPIITSKQESEGQIPKWVIPAFVVVAAIALFGFIYAMQQGEEPDSEQVRIRAAEAERNNGSTDLAPVASDPVSPGSSTAEIPASQNEQTINPDTQTRVMGSDSDRGSVEIKARVTDSKGNVFPVNDEKFYLLDKELSEILRETNLKPIENNSLVNSFGLSVIYPNRFKDFNEKALSAINDHIKYDTLTDSKGTAKMGEIRPDEYYIFGIHKVGKGFAIWSSPILIKPGINNLNIQPQRPVELAVRGG